MPATNIRTNSFAEVSTAYMFTKAIVPAFVRRIGPSTRSQEIARRTVELLLESGDKRRKRVIAASQRDIGDAVTTLQRRQGSEQAHALAPVAEAQSCFPDEQAAQGFFRNAGLIGPLGQKMFLFRMLT